MPRRGNRRSGRLKLLLQLIPVILVAIAGIAGALQLKVVREFLAGASGEPANIVIDPTVSFGPIQRPWKNLAQGGEMNDWNLDPIKGKVAALAPEYIRIDHIYSFFDIRQDNGTYDFSKMDKVIDGILATGAKPYISLSYVPTNLSDDGTITGKPKDWNAYSDLIRATVQHYSGTRGINNVIYEVWNEPDLFGGWKTYGDKNYLELYTYAARGAARAQNTKPYQFGGPAITALYRNWFTKLVEHAQNNNLRLDFFSWHRYDNDVEVFRKDIAQAVNWRAEYPQMSNLQLHITEYGHDSRNHSGYDGNYGAAHTAAASIEMVGSLDRAFVFEIEDGKDPAGQERWGRWGLLTNRDFGNNIKPRYLALRLMDRLQGDQVQLLGKGTWVKAVATRNGANIEMLITNYDRYGSHVETVPVTIKNVVPGSYIMEITDLGGSTRKQPVSTETSDLVTQVVMPANSLMYIKIVPDQLGGGIATPTPAAATLAPVAPGEGVPPVQTVESPVTEPTTLPGQVIQNDPFSAL